MNHRHLLPHEIDLLVDGNASRGIAALRARVEACDDCRAQYDALRRVSDAVDAVPHFMPRLRFADAIMRKVQVMAPWHVGLAGSVRRFIPEGAVPRRLILTGAALMGVAISGAAAWLAFRGDLTGGTFTLALDQTREGMVFGVTQVAVHALGTDAITTLAGGGRATLAITTAVLAAATIGALIGFRRLAAIAAMHRS